jgi:hypothetical protein
LRWPLRNQEGRHYLLQDQVHADPGAIVTMSSNNIDYIVTEYGVAPMKARTVRDRVNNSSPLPIRTSEPSCAKRRTS